MSIEQFVFINAVELPSVGAIVGRAQALGYSLELEDADLQTHTGFLPAVLAGMPTGFESYSGLSNGIPELTGRLPAGLDRFVSTRTGGDLREFVASLIALRALLDLAPGAYWFPDDDNLLLGPDALTFIDEGIREVLTVLKSPTDRP